MSEWSHPICDDCWEFRSTAQPARLIDPDLEMCCFCGNYTKSGIYIREDPEVPIYHHTHEVTA